MLLKSERVGFSISFVEAGVGPERLHGRSLLMFRKESLPANTSAHRKQQQAPTAGCGRTCQCPLTGLHSWTELGLVMRVLVRKEHLHVCAVESKLLGY